MKGATPLSSFVSLLKTIVGAGLLSIPLAFSTDGLILGPLIVLVAAATSGFGLYLQAHVSQFVDGEASFFSLCSMTYPALSVVFDVAIAVQCFGCAVSYLVLVGDLMPTICAAVPIGTPRHFWIAASALVTVPLSFMRNLDSLKYTSVLGLGAIAYLLCFVVAHCVAGTQVERGTVLLAPQGWGAVFSTFSIVVFAFTGHQNMFSIINEARDKLVQSLTRLVVLTISAATALFIIVGFAGYLTFGDQVAGNVILLYPAAWPATFGRFCIALMVLLSFPLMLHPARISVNNILYALKPRESTPLLGGVPFPRGTFYVLTGAMLAVGYVLAATVELFALVLALVGATGLTAISFILPGLFGYSLAAGRVLRTLLLALAAWGFCVMVVCLYLSVANL